MARRSGVVVLALVLTGSVVGVAAAYAKGKHAGGGHRGHAGVTAVQVATARSGTAVSQVTLSGLVTATATIPVSAGVGGRVQAVDVVLGQQVTAGQTLVVLTDPVAQAQLVAAQAAVATASARLTAAQAPATPAAMAVGRAEVAKAQATLAAAQVAYQDTVAQPSRAASGQAQQ
ncbi:MAG: hypothetical protein ACYCU5_12410, partial [Actinomycetes bacterium]